MHKVWEQTCGGVSWCLVCLAEKRCGGMAFLCVRACKVGDACWSWEKKKGSSCAFGLRREQDARVWNGRMHAPRAAVEMDPETVGMHGSGASNGGGCDHAAGARHGVVLGTGGNSR